MKSVVATSVQPFDPNNSAFGRHETFPLRYSWLTKGFQALLADPKVFDSEDATVKLGVGKNMVNAIRYWLQATKIVKKVGRAFQATPVGIAIFGEEGYDPYLEDEATIWLIHWLLATNSELATAWYWFFNRFHKPEFTLQEVATGLLDFSKSELKGKASPTTIKGDAAILLRMYVRSKGNTRTPLEDALDSPLSLLNLVNGVPGMKSYQSRPGTRDGLPLAVFGYAVAELLQAIDSSEIPIDELMYGRPQYPAIGSVFRLTESALLKKLEQLVYLVSDKLEIRETAGIHQLYKLEEIKPLDFLNAHYKTETQGAVA